MPAQELLTFIKNARANKMAENVIIQSLLQSGWNQSEIQTAFHTLENNAQPIPPSQQDQKTETFWPLKQLCLTTLAIYKRRLIPIHVTLFLSTCFVCTPLIIFSYISTQSPITIRFTEPSLSLGSILTYLTLIALTIIGFQWGQTTLAHAVSGDVDLTDTKTVLIRGTKQLISSSILQSLQLLFQLGGYLALLIPGITFSTWFVLTPFVLSSENITGFAALQKSRSYVQGYYWQILIRLVQFWVTALIPILILFGIITLLSQAEGSIVLFCFLLLLLICLAINSFFVCYIYALYTNMVDIKQSEDSDTLGSPIVYIAISFCGIFVVIFLFIISGLREIGTDKSGKFKNARDVTSQANVVTLKDSLAAYRKDVGYYPTSMSLLIPTYLPNQLTDPATDKPYLYTQLDDGTNYKLCLPTGKDCVSETSTTKPLPKVK